MANVYASPLSSLSFAGIEKNKPAALSKSLAKQSTDKTNAQQVVDFGKTLIGTPYLYGGTSPKGFDCSGLVQFVYKQVGIFLPRTSHAQYQSLTKIDHPEVGDLVFFAYDKHINHVGIYVGNNKMLHAPSSNKHVEIASLDSPYWQKRYAGARRVNDLHKKQERAEITPHTATSHNNTRTKEEKHLIVLK